MAIDRLINSTQGDSIIAALDDIATNITASAVESAQLVKNTNAIQILDKLDGAKNLVDLNNATITKSSSVTYTNNNDGTITVNGGGTTANSVIISGITLNAGSYVLSGCPTDGSTTTYYCVLLDSSNNEVSGYDTGEGTNAFTIASTGTYKYKIIFAANYTGTNLVFSPMIITANVANAGLTEFKAYSKSNVELTNDFNNKQDKLTNPVTGAAAWTDADVIVTTNASGGNVVKGSGKSIETSLTSSSDDNVPTSKAVASYITNNITPVKLGFGYTTCTTAAATAAKVATLSNFVLTDGADVSVYFQYAVPANATLNINSTGAKAIVYNNSAITADRIKAGDTVMFVYDSSYNSNAGGYRLVAGAISDSEIDSLWA